MEEVNILLIAIIVVGIGIVLLLGYFAVTGAAVLSNSSNPIVTINQNINYSKDVLLIDAYLESLTERSSKVSDEYFSGNRTLDQTVAEYKDIALRADTLLQVFKQLRPPEEYLEFHQTYLSALEYYNKSKYVYLDYLEERDNKKYEEYNALYINFSRAHSLAVEKFRSS